MNIVASDPLQGQLLQVVAQLPIDKQQQVLDFALSLQQPDPARCWDAISDEDAAALKAEFEQEDLAMAEAGMADYLRMLQREDEA